MLRCREAILSGVDGARRLASSIPEARELSPSASHAAFFAVQAATHKLCTVHVRGGGGR
jgi:hypothetical protein